MQRSSVPVLHDICIPSTGMMTESFTYRRSTYSVLIVHVQAATLEIDSSTHTISGFCCISLPPNTTLRLSQSAENQSSSTEQLRVYACEYEWIGGERLEGHLSTSCLVNLRDSSLLYQMLELHDAFSSQLYNGISRRLSTQAKFLTLLSNAWWTLEQPYAIKLTKSLDGIDVVIAHLNKHYNRKIRREEVVSMSGLSLRRFTQVFKERTGFTLTEYLDRLRIDKVKTFLLQSKKPLRELARQVGYNDEYYLSRKFKKDTGMPPTVYLQKPKSVASLEHAYTVDLLSLGVLPKAAITDTWLNDRFKLPLHTGVFQPLYWQTQHQERLRILQEVKPDLILHPLMDSEEQHALEPYRHIAPVIQIPWRDMKWQQQFEIIAELLGMEQTARNWINNFNDRVGRVRESLYRTWGQQMTAAIINIRSDRTLIYAYGYMGADLLYDNLQLTPPKSVLAMRSNRLEHPEFSEHQLSSYDADHYFLSVENNHAARLRAEATLKHPEWLARTAVQRQCVYEVDMTKWYGYGPAAIDAQLDDVIRLLLPNYPNDYGSI
ncbi:AraC family transcriptional regulator [Cohnella hongkongensis]|uniref:AraC family transcriptional regulator n=1 Tax=Cohnella hongkongensis TaxID=178337 RepID=A0ABV9FKV5_9BACL